MKVIKRDGTSQPFDKGKIEKAILKTCKAVGIEDVVAKELSNGVATFCENHYSEYEDVAVEDLHNYVEKRLMCTKYKEVAKSYIKYRGERDKARRVKDPLKIKIDGLLLGSNKETSLENANKSSEVIPTQRDLVAGEVAKNYALEYMLPKRVASAHRNGLIHFHDLDYSPLFGSYNCQLGGFTKMLKEGFKMGNAHISSPNSIETAATVLSQIVAQITSSSYGGLTVNEIDKLLAPYVEKTYKKHLADAEEFLDTTVCSEEEYARKKTEKSVYNAMQSIEYEINTLHTSNGQSPFCTLGFGLGTSYFERLIQENILKVRLKGLGEREQTPVFPKLCFALKDGVNLKKDDPNYYLKTLAMECQRKRIYPDILNYDKVVEVTGSFKNPMGCRSFLSKYKDKQDNVLHESRNNLGVITLSPLKCALDSEKDIDKFWKYLEYATDIVKEGLLYRVQRFDTVKAESAPILYQNGSLNVDLKPNDIVAPVFKDGFSSVSLGFVGLHETVLYLTDEKPFESERAYNLQMEILKFLDDKTKEWKEETGYGFSTYSTPNESTSLRLVNLYKQDYGVIDGVTDHVYLTNSFHLDVTQNCNAFDKIDFEAPFIKYTSGGFVTTVDLPNMESNHEAHEAIIDYAYTKVPYFLINQPVDKCFVCGYEGEFLGTEDGYTCPNCGNKEAGTMNVIRRISGYISEPDCRPFNPAKQTEVIRRVKHV